MNIRPSVLIVSNGKFLTLKYNYNGNKVYALPGGNLEFGERMIDALKRELMEELFIEVTIDNLRFVAEVHQEKKDTLHLVFNGSINNGIPKINPNETSAESFEWVPLLEVENFSLYPNVGEYLNSYSDSPIFLGTIHQPWY